MSYRTLCSNDVITRFIYRVELLTSKHIWYLERFESSLCYNLLTFCIAIARIVLATIVMTCNPITFDILPQPIESDIVDAAIDIIDTLYLNSSKYGPLKIETYRFLFCYDLQYEDYVKDTFILRVHNPNLSFSEMRAIYDKLIIKGIIPYESELSDCLLRFHLDSTEISFVV